MKLLRNSIFLVSLVALGLSCTDEEKDPFQFAALEKGIMFALRDGQSDDNFFIKNIPGGLTGTETFSYSAELLAEDQDILQEVQVFAQLFKDSPRQLVATLPASNFPIPSGGVKRRGTVSVPLSDINNALGLVQSELDTLTENAIEITTDLILTDGRTVLASSIVSNGLFQSALFFPAHALIYSAIDIDELKPVATSKMAGEVVKNAANVVTSRPVFPLKAGSSDTVMFTFGGAEIVNTPTITYNPAAAFLLGASGVLVNASTGVQTFFQVVTAEPGFTVAGTATASGGITEDFLGVPIVQNPKTQVINIDNTGPLQTGSSTGTRVGRGQFVTIVVNFNERLSAKSANVIKATVTDPNGKLVPLNAVNMAIASNGLSASVNFVFNEINLSDPAIHGDLVLSFTGGADEAGNPVQGTITTDDLTADVGIPPAPVLTLDPVDFDLGTQIKWSASQSTGANNPKGAIGGTIFFIAVDAGTPAPTIFGFDADNLPEWRRPDPTPTDPLNTIVVAGKQKGSLTTSGTTGLTGSVFTAFTADGTFDIYAVFLGSTGNQSVVPVTPQLASVTMAPN